MTKGGSNERIFRFIHPESVACAPYADARRRHGRSAVALAEDLCVRPVSARATLHAWARTEMAREARAQRWVVAHAALPARQNAALFARRRIRLDLGRRRWLRHKVGSRSFCGFWAEAHRFPKPNRDRERAHLRLGALSVTREGRFFCRN